MTEVDCRQCKNLIDTERGCKLYGSNADEAVKKCADNNFRRYRIKYDKRTRAWFSEHFGVQTTVEQCKECGLFYKPSLGHECEVKESMKPILIEDKMWTCPICGNNLMHKYKKYPTLKNTKKDALTFCLSCGCRIDWSEIGGEA